MERLFWAARLCAACGVVLAALAIGVFAQEGEADLEEARNLKIDAKSLQDLDRVVALCESALKKGLNEESATEAKALLVGTSVTTGERLVDPILNGGQLDQRWQFMRRQGLSRLQKALKYDDNLGEVHLMVARLQILPGGDPESAKKSVARALELLKDDKPSLAQCEIVSSALSENDEERLKHLDKAIEYDPENDDALLARGLFHALKNDGEKAVADFKAVLALDGSNEMARRAVVETLMKSEKTDEALGVLEEALKAQPENATNFMMRARLYIFKQETEKALADLDKAIEIDSENVEALLMRAELRLQSDKDDAALEDVEKALSVRPGLVAAILLRSLAYANKKKYDLAASDLELLVENAPDNPGFKLQLAFIYAADEQPNRAIKLYNEVIKLDEGNYRALIGRADAYLALGKHAEAKADFESCYKINQEDDHLLNNYSWLLSTSTDDSIRDGKKALELGLKASEVTEYKQSHILSTLAAAYAETGDFEKAKEWSKKAVEMSEGENKDSLKKELESYEQGKPWREKQDTKEKKPNQGGGTIDL